MDANIRMPMETASFSFWCDQSIDERIGGDAWWKEIARRISDATAFVFLFTDLWQNSPICRRELATAEEMNKCIIPVQIEEFRVLPQFLYIFREKHISILYKMDGRVKFPQRLEAALDLVRDDKLQVAAKDSDRGAVSGGRAATPPSQPSLAEFTADHDFSERTLSTLRLRIIPLLRRRLELVDIATVSSDILRAEWLNIAPIVPIDIRTSLRNSGALSESGELTDLGVLLLRRSA